MRSTSPKVLDPAVKFVIFMAQRQSANTAVVRVRLELTIISSNSAKLLTVTGKRTCGWIKYRFKPVEGQALCNIF